ncbi:hypothetical protein KBI31_01790 [Patescibacteria group bacterium]|nr:hypothetical protein [Patescibacteria group bacterium]HPD07752.1 hypothetical protein [bacterium]HRT11077.1 hypothetical protein [Patescibacteria group bacterium]HRU90125.1 hypothetical protein [Patescibacteria group bacterium]
MIHKLKKILSQPYFWLIIGIILVIVILGLIVGPTILEKVEWHKWQAPFFNDARTSLGGESPEEAYQKFWQAMQANERDTALAYVIGVRRPYFQRAWEDPALWALDQSLPETTSLVFIGDCLPDAIACKKRAVLSYSTATTTGRIELYQNLAGRWQIGDIY